MPRPCYSKVKPISHSNVLTCKGKIHVTIQLQNSSNNSRGDYHFFCTNRGRLFEGRQLLEERSYFKYCSLEVVPHIFCFIPLNQKLITSNKLNMGFLSVLNQKLITSNKLNMGFLSVPNLVP